MRRMPAIPARIPALVAFGLVGAVLPAAAGPWVDAPQVEFARYGFVSEVVDATAIFLNPAGLAGGPGTNFYGDLSGNFDFPLEWTASLQGKALGFGYRHRNSRRAGDLPAGETSITDAGSLDTYVLAGGYGPSSFRLGISSIWNKTTMPGKDSFSLNAGFQSFMNQSFAMGFLVENIEHPDFLGGQLRPRYTYGLTIRVKPRILTVNVQGMHHDGSIERITMLYGARVAFSSGWAVSGLLRDLPGEPPTFGLSGTWFFGKGAVSARARTQSGNDDWMGQAALQIYDEFWQEGTRKKPAGPVIPRRR